jgi:hypothetical protein
MNQDNSVLVYYSKSDRNWSICAGVLSLGQTDGLTL